MIKDKLKNRKMQRKRKCYCRFFLWLANTFITGDWKHVIIHHDSQEGQLYAWLIMIGFAILPYLSTI